MKINEGLENNFIIGIISGAIAGLILLLGQFIAELYDQKYNILLIGSIVALLIMVMIVIIAWKNTKK